MNAVAEEGGFVAAYLNRTPVARFPGADKLGWNAGSCCGVSAEKKSMTWATSGRLCKTLPPGTVMSAAVFLASWRFGTYGLRARCSPVCRLWCHLAANLA